MRKIIVSNYISLDGFFAGKAGEIDWFVWDEETAEYSKKLGNSIGGILFGRVTYEGMASYWPTEVAAQEDPVITEFMNRLPKIVFSRTLKRADWNNTRIIGEISEKTILDLKREQGKDLVIYGSGSLVSALTRMGLIDDYLIFVNPVILGAGKQLFPDVAKNTGLKLVETKVFGCGVVLLHYVPSAAS